MFTWTKRILAIGMALAVCWAGACAVSVGGGGGVAPFVAFTIGGQTFTFSLGTAGVFNVQRGAPPVRGGLRVEGLFDQPTDRPTAGDLVLNPSNVRVTPLNVGKAVAPLQGLTGSFEVAVYLANVNVENACEEGSYLGTFHATSMDAAVSLDTSSLALSQAALQEAISGAFTLCLEVSGDIDATITINEMGVQFAPTDTEPDDGDGQEPGVETTVASFTFRNEDVENIHFLLPNDIFSAENKVEPGQTRTATIADAQIGAGVVIQAGRNGTVLAVTDCPVVTGPGYSATVVWNGATLTCEADQPGDGGDAGTSGGDAGTSGGDALGTSVEGCWQVTVDDADPDIEYVYQFDAEGNLERIWRVYWDRRIVEEERYTVANLSPFFAGYFRSPTQNVSVEVEGTQVTVSVTHSVIVNDYEEALDGSCSVESSVPLLVTTTITGVVLSLTSPDSFAGASYSYTWEFPDEILPSEPATASGARVNCPDASDPNVYSQEEQVDYCQFEPQGAAVDPDG